MSVEDWLNEFIPFLCVPLCILIFNTLIRITKDIAQGNIEIGKRETERKEKANDLKKINIEKKINIDEDLQKYFNYKERNNGN